MIGVKVTHNAPSSGLFRYWLARAFMAIMGWNVTGKFPDDKKFVLIGAPHTSNWDFFLGLATIFIFRVKAQWLAKDSIFIWPVGILLRSLGGIPIDRKNAHGVVGQMADALTQSEQQVILLAPSGTRKKMPNWRSGFYHIAHQANVPIVCGSLDFKTKQANIGLSLLPTGNIEKDMDKIRQYYKEINAKYPEMETSVRLAEES
ncbi:MAG: lysophospholipid acyltransferase family protein [Gammaproteobacteria bacterium]|nr:lysophospholipid acyltransferase family protein [Gammaproteobacteria bacterium]